jgi:hypothetical protein
MWLFKPNVEFSGGRPGKTYQLKSGKPAVRCNAGFGEDIYP